MLIPMERLQEVYWVQNYNREMLLLKPMGQPAAMFDYCSLPDWLTMRLYPAPLENQQQPLLHTQTIDKCKGFVYYKRW